MARMKKEHKNIFFEDSITLDELNSKVESVVPQEFFDSVLLHMKSQEDVDCENWVPVLVVSYERPMTEEEELQFERMERIRNADRKSSQLRQRDKLLKQYPLEDYPPKD